VKESCYSLLHQIFVGSNLQEAPTSNKAPSPTSFLQATTHRRLLHQHATTCFFSSYDIERDKISQSKNHVKNDGYLIYISVVKSTDALLLLFTLYLFSCCSYTFLCRLFLFKKNLLPFHCIFYKQSILGLFKYLHLPYCFLFIFLFLRCHSIMGIDLGSGPEKVTQIPKTLAQH